MPTCSTRPSMAWTERSRSSGRSASSSRPPRRVSGPMARGERRGTRSGCAPGTPPSAAGSARSGSATALARALVGGWRPARCLGTARPPVAEDPGVQPLADVAVRHRVVAAVQHDVAVRVDLRPPRLDQLERARRAGAARPPARRPRTRPAVPGGWSRARASRPARRSSVRSAWLAAGRSANCCPARKLRLTKWTPFSTFPLCSGVRGRVGLTTNP